MKITQAGVPTIRMDCHHIQTNWCPHLCHPHQFYAGCPSWHNPPNSSWPWDRHQICWLGYPVAYLIAAIVITLKVIPLLQAFSSAIFHICGAFRGSSAFAELLILNEKHCCEIENCCLHK